MVPEIHKVPRLLRCTITFHSALAATALVVFQVACMAHFRLTPCSQLASLLTKSSIQQELQEGLAEASGQIPHLKEQILHSTTEKVMIAHFVHYTSQ